MHRWSIRAAGHWFLPSPAQLAVGHASHVASSIGAGSVLNVGRRGGGGGGGGGWRTTMC